MYIQPSKTKLINYSGSQINKLKVKLNCRVEGKNDQVNLEFNIVVTENKSPVILGLESCKLLKLNQRG